MNSDDLAARGVAERTPLENIAFAAWVNCPPDAIPPEYRQHTCEATMIAWRRVVAALMDPAALATSPEVQAMIREAEARVWQAAALAARIAMTKDSRADELTCSICADAIRAEAAALKGETT